MQENETTTNQPATGDQPGDQPETRVLLWVAVEHDHKQYNFKLSTKDDRNAAYQPGVNYFPNVDRAYLSEFDNVCRGVAYITHGFYTFGMQIMYHLNITSHPCDQIMDQLNMIVDHIQQAYKENNP